MVSVKLCVYVCDMQFRFGIKEEWMEFMNAFVSAEFSNMRKFLQNISVNCSTHIKYRPNKFIIYNKKTAT